ncbi:MAG: hypothetical protein ACREJ5_05575 [Geminicoccaceae bacterium]
MTEPPKIGLTQLSEYMVATPGRRRAIVEEINDPKPYIVAVYNDASDLMIRYCSAGSSAQTIANAGLADLHAKASSPTLSDPQRQNARLCIEAIEGAVKMFAGLNLPECEIVPLAQGAPPMMIEGVQVNVRPEAIIRQVVGRNRPGVGAIKFYFPRTKKLSAERAAYMGTILQWYCEHSFANSEADHRLCSIIDAVGGKVHAAPKATKRRREDVRGACEEIRIRSLGS